MSESLQHTCTKDESRKVATGEECLNCQLASLCNKETKKSSAASMEDDDDYSISEQLSSKENDHTILYLVIIGIATLALVVLFTKYVFGVN